MSNRLPPRWKQCPRKGALIDCKFVFFVFFVLKNFDSFMIYKREIKVMKITNLNLLN